LRGALLEAQIDLERSFETCATPINAYDLGRKPETDNLAQKGTVFAQIDPD
jgi:hypothetical protein